jgi:hypothetical protein
MMDSGMLTARRRPGLPRRRRLGSLYLTILAGLCLFAGLSVGSKAGLLAGLSAGLSVLLLPVLMAPVWLVTFSIGRARLRRLRDQHNLGADSIAVRTTADFSRFPPTELNVVESYVRPWTTYQLLTITDRGIELRNFPGRGKSAGALLRFDRVESIEVGTAGFGDLTERAILIAGTERGTSYHLGLVPIDDNSLTLRPVGDKDFRAIIEAIVAEARSTTGHIANAST